MSVSDVCHVFSDFFLLAQAL